MSGPGVNDASTRGESTRGEADPFAWGRIQSAEASTAGEQVTELATWAPAAGEVRCQTHGGVTRYALAAYAAFRDRFHSSGRVVVGSHEVLDHLGKLVLVTAVSGDGLMLLLDGLTWGFRGTGPSGLAAMLVDLGAQPDWDAAKRWVADLPLDEAWRIEVAP